MLQLQDMENAGGHDQHLYTSSTQHGGGRPMKSGPVGNEVIEDRTSQFQSSDELAADLGKWLQLNGETYQQRRNALRELLNTQLQSILKLMGEKTTGMKEELVLRVMSVYQVEQEKREKLERVQRFSEEEFHHFYAHHPIIQILQIHARGIWRAKQENK